MSLQWIGLLSFANLLFSSALIIVVFSLIIYILANARNEVTMSFTILLAAVMVVYVGDVVVPWATSQVSTQRWLRLQWLGIAYVPAAYLHITDAIFKTTLPSSQRRAAVIGSYILSTFLVTLAAFSDLLVGPVIYRPFLSVLKAGPLFLFFVFYYIGTVTYGMYTIYKGYAHAMTPVARRRIVYLGLAFTAPGVAVFPYLVFSNSSSNAYTTGLVLTVNLVGTFITATMIILMAYVVTYYSGVMPDRMIRRNMMRFLLRGPTLAALLIVLTLTISRLHKVMGIPRDVLWVFALATATIIFQGLVHWIEPIIDRLIYTQDRQELDWLAELNERLLTTSDLRQFLTNVLLYTCEQMRSDNGFIAVVEEDEWHVEVTYGQAASALNFLTAHNLAQVLPKIMQPQNTSPFHDCNDFWIAPLWAPGKKLIIGLFGIAPPPQMAEVSQEIIDQVEPYLRKAEAAVQDRYLQVGIFSIVEDIMPTIAQLQQTHGLRGQLGLDTGSAGTMPASERQRDLIKLVHEALSHFWGGPRLQQSPLLNLRAVNEEIANGKHPTRALQSVLLQAIEQLRPEGQRHMTTSEWLLYNILELKFIQGKKVHEVARRLAMSESDLYRKQRIAIAEVARILQEMETGTSPKEVAEDKEEDTAL